jgi:hypothetical protein
MQRITPNLWFDDQAEVAAKFYTGVFKNSKISTIARYGSAGPQPAGTVMMVDFELDGQQFAALNGGPADFKFNEALAPPPSQLGQPVSTARVRNQRRTSSGATRFCDGLRYGPSW